MRVLIDTHILIWLIADPDRIRDEEWAVIEHPRTDVLVSVVSLWEMRMKCDAAVRRGLSGNAAVDPVKAIAFVDDAGFVVDPLTRDLVIAMPVPALDHHDPYDRMLLVHAQQRGARLLTRDPALLIHPVALRT